MLWVGEHKTVDPLKHEFFSGQVGVVDVPAVKDLDGSAGRQAESGQNMDRDGLRHGYHSYSIFQYDKESYGKKLCLAGFKDDGGRTFFARINTAA